MIEMAVLDEVRTACEGQSGPLVAIAEALASRLDDPDEKSPAPVAKELRATLLAISEVAPREEDPLDALADRIANRVAAATGPNGTSKRRDPR